MKRTTSIALIALLFLPAAHAQQVLSLEDCRQLAISGNKELEEARQKTVMADYDKKIALSNYFPSISANGTYMYNSRNLSLVTDEQSAALAGLGTTVQGQLSKEMESLMTSMMSNPQLAAKHMSSPMWQAVIGELSRADVSEALNRIGSNINDALHFDIKNIYAGAVSIQQPVFMGGKIVASNQIAALAKELSQTEYDEKCLTIEMETENSYWQVVSLSAKNSLATAYVELLERLEKDAEISVAEGVAVQSDLLAIRVKKNEATMLKTKAQNGLALSKMLMCRQLGIPLDSQIRLADEDDESIPDVEYVPKRDIESVLTDRNEARMLDLAAKIYEKKVAVVRADHLPKIALTGNYLITNPNLYSGFRNEFGGMFNIGVMVSIPIFHATEGYQKIRKAEAEAKMYQIRYEDACDMISLQIEQLCRNQDEALENLEMAKSNLDCADENLRAAMLGFSEGVISSDVALQAQTAWVKAQTEFIDAGIEVQLNHSKLLKAQGLYK